MTEQNNKDIIDAEEVPVPPTGEPTDAQKAEVLRRLEQLQQRVAQAQASGSVTGVDLLGSLQRLGVPYELHKHVPAQPQTDHVKILLSDIVEADKRMAAKAMEAFKTQQEKAAGVSE